MAGSASKVVSLVLKVVIFVLLVMSMLIIATNSQTVELDIGTYIIRFNDVVAYRYMLAASVLGIAYTLLQIALSIYSLIMSGDGLLVFNFYGDLFLSYLLATGAAAGLGVTKDMKASLELAGVYFTKFYEKAYASASLLFLAFICSILLSILSSYTLPKRV